MPKTFQHLALTLGVLAAVGAAGSAGAPDARAILDRTANTYRHLTSFHFAGKVAIEMTRPDAHQSFDFPILAAAARPGRWRTEMRNPSMGMVVVNDGRTLTTYSQQSNQYSRKAVPANAAADTGAAVAGPGSPLARYFGIANSVRSARWVGSRLLALGGRRVECDLVAVEYQHPSSPGTEYSPTTFWIEKARALVLRDSTRVRMNDPAHGGAMDLAQTTTYTTARINEKLPDSLFAFRPPPGSTEVSSFRGEETPDLTGRPAEDFTLNDLAGKPVRLSSLRGKVVLLDFWATWCGPCRLEMPNIEKLHRQFKNRGLVVLGVNQGEEPAPVRSFLKKNGYDFRVLLDGQQQVAERYQVSGIPTLFIIDQAGTIRTHFVGVRDESTLREALARAGIK
jgi:peroxiredoxin/outer membrane lipoprotein-sorting protein